MTDSPRRMQPKFRVIDWSQRKIQHLEEPKCIITISPDGTDAVFEPATIRVTQPGELTLKDAALLYWRLEQNRSKHA